MTKKCEVCEATSDEKRIKLYHGERYLCDKHYSQMRRCGKILLRTTHDKNEIIREKDYYDIYLYNINKIKIARFKIDLEDINKIKKYKWCLNNKGYVITKHKHIDKKIFLHHLIIGRKDGLVVDHINGDILDNRKSNLRFCTQHQNTMNSKVPKSNSSGIKGVRKIKKTGNWVAEIKFNYKSINLGTFPSKDIALKARKEAEIKYFGEYRYKYNNKKIC